MKVKLVAKEKGMHVQVKVFMGEGDTLANCGELRMLFGEWQLFGVAISMGAKRTNGHLIAEIDDSAIDHNQGAD